MAYCSNCGAEIGDQVKFCPECGHPTVVKTQAQPPNVLRQEPEVSAQVSSPSQARPKKKRKTSPLLLGIIAVLLCVCVSISYTVLQTGSDDKASVASTNTPTEPQDSGGDPEAATQPTKTTEGQESTQLENTPASTPTKRPGSTSTQTATLLPPTTGIATTAVNLRNGPGTDYDKVGALQEGEQVEILTKTEDSEWYEVKLGNDDTAWVAAAYVDVATEIALIPIATPTLTPTGTSTPSPTATTTPLPPLYVEYFNMTPYGSDGDLWLYGQVRNSGTLPAKSAKLAVTVYDKDDKVLGDGFSYADTPLALNLWNTGVLYPGEQAPFSILVKDAAAWDDWVMKLTYEEAKNRHFGNHYKDLEIINDLGRFINEILCEYKITGEIKNVGELETGTVWLIATLYDAQGHVVGIGESITDTNPLMPDQKTVFSICVFALKGQAASYELMIRSIKH